MTPLGKGIKTEYPLLGLEDILEDVNLLLGIGLVGGFGLVYKFFEGEERVLSSTRNQGRELDRLLA